MMAGLGKGDFIVSISRKVEIHAPTDVTSFGIPELCQVSGRPGEIEFTTDAGNLYAVFGDLETGVFSSSLRAVLSGGGRKYQINGDALCEQLVTGAIAGRETCFQGIERLDGCETSTVLGTRISFRRTPLVTADSQGPFRSSRSCADYQLQILREHFREIARLAGDRKVSMGLSGGFDSRLMLLLALEAGILVHPFTFASANHNTEQRVAAELAQRTGLHLREITVRLVDDLDDTALDANIDDAIHYYDGRTNETMGTFGDVHTARIQRQCMGEASLNLNGLGGELYRNRERLPVYGFSFRNWLWHCVIGPRGYGAFISDKARQSFEERLTRKYADLLGLGKLVRFDRHLARRWYRDIWLPYFAGPRLSAENRVGPALMPFADGAVSTAALAATPFVGSHGEFEAALIRRLDEKIAALPSLYGPGFSPSPLSQRLREQGLSLIPLRARLARHLVLAQFNRSLSSGIIRWHKRFDEPVRFLKAMKLPLNIDFLLHNRGSRDRTLFIAEFLNRHRQYLDVLV